MRNMLQIRSTERKYAGPLEGAGPKMEIYQSGQTKLFERWTKKVRLPFMSFFNTWL